MAFKTFEQVEQETGPEALYFNYAPPKPAVPEGYETEAQIKAKAEVASRSVIAAAFRQDNTVASVLTREDAGVDNRDDPNFNIVDYVKSNGIEDYSESFSGVLNARKADAIKAQIEREQRDRQTLEASGWTGTFAMIAAGVFDAPTLIPGTVAVRGAKGGWSVTKSMLMAGASAGASQAATEGVLQSVQQTRTAEESIAYVGAAVVLGSVLGGSVAALMSKAERKAAIKAMENISDIENGTFRPPGGAPQTPAGLSAQIADDAFYVDPVDAVRTRGELAVEGKAAGAVVQATSWLNPVLRATQRYAASARQLGNTLFENTIYRSMHSAGETTGVSVEAAVRTSVDGRLATAQSAAETSYKEMVGAGTKMRRDEFYQSIGDAMISGDKHDNPFVESAAKAFRKELFNPYTNEALQAQLIKEKDLDVKTAESYLTRVYAKEVLEATEGKFLDRIGRYYAEQMQVEYRQASDSIRARAAKYRQYQEDVQLSGPARSERIAELNRQVEALDANEELFDKASRISELRGDAGKGDAAARAEIERIKTEGGEELKTFLDTRRDLRARKRALVTQNVERKTQRYERLVEQMDELQDMTERSLGAFAKRAKNLMVKLQSDPVGRAEDAVMQIERQAADAQALIERTQDRLARIAERNGDSDELARARELLTQREERMADLLERITERDAGLEAAQKLADDLDGMIEDITSATASRSLRRGERMAALKKRAESLDPEVVRADAAAQKARYDKLLEAAEERFYNRWETRRGLGLETAERYDFEAAGRAAAKDIYDKITGKIHQREDIPPFAVRVTSGPMRERLFIVPDKLLASEGWLVRDVRQIARFYARSMAGEIELTRRFGRADMGEQLAKIRQDYSDLKVAVDRATTPADINKVLGRNKFSDSTPLEKAKLDAAKMLEKDEKSAIQDTKAGRDLIRGTYNQGVSNTNAASMARSVMHYNYIRSMGGWLFANFADMVRPGFVHGLKNYLTEMPKYLGGMFTKSEGYKLLRKEAELAGLAVERVQRSMITANGDIADPYLAKTTHIERFLQKGTSAFSRWNLMSVVTDFQQAISYQISSHRIMEAVVGNAGVEGSFVKGGDGDRLLRMLGISKSVQADIARMVALHGETVDGIKVANTERWLKWAQETGNSKELHRIERAVRDYRAAINTDVSSIISKRGLGDTPLFAQHPLGKMLTQFSGYAMGAHSRVTVRGLQEGHTRMIGGLTAMTAIGAFSSYLSAWRAGRDYWERFNKEVKDNPMRLVAEGLDRSGVFPLFFDMANRVERSVGDGYNYRFNPIKTPISALGGGGSVTSTKGGDTVGWLGALGGPTMGLIDSTVAAKRVIDAHVMGGKPSIRDKKRAMAVIPGQSYFGLRELLQVLNGDSQYTKEH